MTLPVSETFTGADQIPLSGWLTLSGSPLARIGEKLTSSNVYPACGYWSASKPAVDCEITATLSGLSGEVSLILRLNPSAYTYYCVTVAPTYWAFFRYNSASNRSQLGFGQERTTTAGTVVKFRVVGKTLSVFFDGVLAPHSVTDVTPILQEGYAGIGLLSRNDSVDNLTISNFTSTLPVTETFTGNDQSPLTDRWATVPDRAPLARVGGRVTSSGNWSSWGYWTGEIPPADSEISATFSVVTTAGMSLNLRLNPLTHSLYYVNVTSTGWQFYKGIDSVFYPLGTLQSRTTVNGTIVKFRVVGTTLSVYFNGVKAAYTYTDTSNPYTRTGHAAIWIGDNAQYMDNVTIAAVTTPISGSISRTSSAEGYLTTAIRLQKSTYFVSSAAGVLKTEIYLSSSTSATATVAGSVSEDPRLLASCRVVAAANGSLQSEIVLAVTSTASVICAGTLATEILLAGDSAGAAGPAALLTTDVTLRGAVGPSIVWVTANVTTAVTLGVAVTGTSTVTGKIATGRLEVELLSVATVTGDVTTAILFSAESRGQSTVESALHSEIRLTQSISGTSQVTGAIESAIHASVTVLTVATPTADLSTAVTLQSDLTATNSLAADLYTEASPPLQAWLFVAQPAVAGELDTAVTLQSTVYTQNAVAGSISAYIQLGGGVYIRSMVSGRLIFGNRIEAWYEVTPRYLQNGVYQAYPLLMRVNSSFVPVKLKAWIVKEQAQNFSGLHKLIHEDLPGPLAW